MLRFLAAIVLLTPPTARSPVTLAVAFSPDGRFLATHGFGPLLLSVAETGKEVRRVVPGRGGLGAALFTPDGKGLLSYDPDGGLSLFPVVEGAGPRRVAQPAPDAVNDLFCQSISPDGKRLATGGFDGRVKLWDLSSGKRLLELAGLPRPVYSVSFTPDGKTVVSVAWEDGLRFWDAATGEQTRFIAHVGDGVAVSPDGKLVAASGHPKSGTKLWDLGTGKEQRRWEAGSGCVAFSPDGRTLAAGCGDTIRLWELTAGKELQSLTVDGRIHAIAFRPDGKMLACAARGRDENGNDLGVFRAWDLPSGAVRYTLRPR